MAASTAIRKETERASARKTPAHRSLRLPPRWSAGRVAGVLLVVGGVLGCGSDTTAARPVPPAQLYWSIGLNQHAVMLALQPGYDTVQLTTTPQNAQGVPIATTGTVSFKALDSTVSVSAAGLVTARYPTAVGRPVKVAATLRDPAQGVTHSDTVWIAVTTTVPPAIDTFSMQPVAGDSAKRALIDPAIKGQARYPWPARARDANGTLVCSVQSCGLLVYYTSSKPVVARIDPLSGTITTLDTGHVVFTAQTLAYHQVLRDSVQVHIGYILWTLVAVALTMLLGVLTVGFVGTPKKLILGVGAIVSFCSSGSLSTNKANSKPVDIVFDHPESVDSATCEVPGFGDESFYAPATGSGNLTSFGGDTTNPSLACRRFNVPGVYRYHSTLFPSDTYEIDVRADAP